MDSWDISTVSYLSSSYFSFSVELKWGLKPCNSKVIETLVCIQLQLNSVGATNSIFLWVWHICPVLFIPMCIPHPWGTPGAPHSLAQKAQWPYTGHVQKSRPQSGGGPLWRPGTTVKQEWSSVVICRLLGRQDSTNISEGRRGWTIICNLFLLGIPPSSSLMVFFHAMGFFVVVGVESQTDREWSKKVTACLSSDFNVEM